jgi:hypothetical protein
MSHIQPRLKIALATAAVAATGIGVVTAMAASASQHSVLAVQPGGQYCHHHRRAHRICVGVAFRDRVGHPAGLAGRLPGSCANTNTHRHACTDAHSYAVGNTFAVADGMPRRGRRWRRRLRTCCPLADSARRRRSHLPILRHRRHNQSGL